MELYFHPLARLTTVIASKPNPNPFLGKSFHIFKPWKV